MSVRVENKQSLFVYERSSAYRYTVRGLIKHGAKNARGGGECVAPFLYSPK